MALYRVNIVERYKKWLLPMICSVFKFTFVQYYAVLVPVYATINGYYPIGKR